MPDFTFSPQVISHVNDALNCILAYKDINTQRHSSRVVLLAQELGQALDISDTEHEILTLAAAFHDIGKIGIPDAILNKPGKLDSEEWAIMQTHTTIGEDIITRLHGEESKAVGRVVRHHHEHHDGKGYPDGLSGSQIPLLSRIIALADCYDALACDRQYRTGMPHERVIHIMLQDVEKKFDPEISEIFFSLIETSSNNNKN